MEDNEELRLLLAEKNRLEETLTKVDGKITTIINQMAFNISDITKILADLLTSKENETYTFGCIETKKNSNNVLSFKITNDKMDEPINIGNVIYLQYGKIGKRTFNPYNVNITFKCLLDSYDISPSYNKNMLCDYDFSDYPYVLDFIDYLFLLQCDTNKKISYDEMKKAMNEYLKNGKTDHKKLVRKKDL